MVDFLVYRGVLFYVQVAGGNVGFRLVVVVVRNKVFDGVFGKEGLELAVKLGAQSFVVANDKRGPLDGFDDFGHRECLSASCNAL